MTFKNTSEKLSTLNTKITSIIDNVKTEFNKDNISIENYNGIQSGIIKLRDKYSSVISEKNKELSNSYKKGEKISQSNLIIDPSYPVEYDKLQLDFCYDDMGGGNNSVECILYKDRYLYIVTKEYLYKKRNESYLVGVVHKYDILLYKKIWKVTFENNPQHSGGKLLSVDDNYVYCEYGHSIYLLNASNGSVSKTIDENYNTGTPATLEDFSTYDYFYKKGVLYKTNSNKNGYEWKASINQPFVYNDDDSATTACIYNDENLDHIYVLSNTHVNKIRKSNGSILSSLEISNDYDSSHKTRALLYSGDKCTAYVNDSKIKILDNRGIVVSTKSYSTWLNDNSNIPLIKTKEYSGLYGSHVAKCGNFVYLYYSNRLFIISPDDFSIKKSLNILAYMGGIYQYGVSSRGEGPFVKLFNSGKILTGCNIRDYYYGTDRSLKATDHVLIAVYSLTSSNYKYILK